MIDEASGSLPGIRALILLLIVGVLAASPCDAALSGAGWRNVPVGGVMWLTQYHPSVWTDSKGFFVAYVTEQGIILSRQIDDSTFVSDEYPTGFESEIAWRPQIVGADGDLLVLWSAYDGITSRVKVSRMEYATGLASEPMTLATERVATDLARIDDTFVAVMLDGLDQVWSISSSDGGATWMEPLLVGPERLGVSYSFPRLAVGGDEVYCVFSTDLEPDVVGGAVLYRSADAARSWNPVRSFPADEVGSFYYRVMAGGSDLAVAGQGDVDQRPAVFLVGSADRGITWSDPVVLRSGGWPREREYCYPELVVDRSGVWHVVGIAGSNGVYGDLIHRESDDRGEAWSAPDTLNERRHGAWIRDSEQSFRLRVDGDDLFVAYSDYFIDETMIHIASRLGTIEEPSLGALGVVPRHNPSPRTEVAELLVFLPVGATLRSAVFNVFGREILSWTVPDAGSGETTLRWDGRDQRGRRVGAGVYFWRVEAGGRLGSRTVRQVLY